jgi:DNA-binding transcriptional ArsR family regulator
MSTPLPLRPSIEHNPQSESAFFLEDDGATAILETLACEKARKILTSLATKPATTSELADRVDTSLQNVQYHLTNLLEAELIDEVGTWYSAKGTEMTVYAPTSMRLELRLKSTDGYKSIGQTL